MRYALFAIAALPLLAQAEGLNGRTADGCTYKVINGQYLTSCPTSRPAAAQDLAQTAAAAPVTDYSAVPVRQNSQAPAPALQQPALQEVPFTAPPSHRGRIQAIAAEDREEAARDRLRARLIDKTYVGGLIGSNSMKAASAGGGMGLGVNLGTNIDENLGVEFAYAYAKQDLNLGLASRALTPSPNASLGGSDSSLSSHLFSAELQAHLTDPVKRLRPYLGLGLGWKTSTLEENANSPLTGAANGSLHQNIFGGLGTAGTKLRLSQAFQLGLAFRYFFPIARQAASLEQPQGASGTDLTKADSALTGSAQSQLLGGVQYLF
jgi:outer membrane protein W